MDLQMAFQLVVQIVVSSMTRIRSEEENHKHAMIDKEIQLHITSNTRTFTLNLEELKISNL